MKKIFLSTLVLTAFSLSILLFQISCKKDVLADTPDTSVKQLNKIIYTKWASADNWGIYTANFDGSNETKINIVGIPSDIEEITTVTISPNGNTIFFATENGNTWSMYSCTIDGSNLKTVINKSSSSIQIHSAY